MPSAAIISATGIVQAKRQVIKKLRKSLNPNWLKKLKRTKNLFGHMTEAKVKAKSNLDH